MSDVVSGVVTFRHARWSTMAGGRRQTASIAAILCMVLAVWSGAAMLIEAPPDGPEPGWSPANRWRDPAGVAVHGIQLRQMEGIAKLVGYLAPAEFDQTVDILLNGGSTPIIAKEPNITEKPEGAWTHAVPDRTDTEKK